MKIGNFRVAFITMTITSILMVLFPLHVFADLSFEQGKTDWTQQVSYDSNLPWTGHSTTFAINTDRYSQGTQSMQLAASVTGNDSPDRDFTEDIAWHGPHNLSGASHLSIDMYGVVSLFIINPEDPNWETDISLILSDGTHESRYTLYKDNPSSETFADRQQFTGADGNQWWYRYYIPLDSAQWGSTDFGGGPLSAVDLMNVKIGISFGAETWAVSKQALVVQGVVDNIQISFNSNVLPGVGAIAAPADPIQVNTTINVSAPFTDPNILDTHTAVWSWGDGSTSPGVVNEVNGSGSVVGSHTFTTPGAYEITLTVTDNYGGTGTGVYDFVVVYDSTAGFVTGVGWINSPVGAYPAHATLTGKANFGFVSKYKKGTTVPTGNTEFQFQAGDLNFHSDGYQWLVVNQDGTNAQFKGSGTINGAGDYLFMIWAGDGTPDTFRIKIWEEDESENETVRYDNGFSQAIGAGSIIVHKSK